MAKTEEQIKEEFLFIVENNKEMLEKVIASYNNFLAEYRKFLQKDYAELTIYEAIESAESYALEKDEEEGGTFYAELLTDWYDEQVLEWKNRLDGLKNDYMIESVPVIDPEDNVDWGDYVRPVIYDITDWGALHFYYGSAAHFYQYISYMFLHSTDSLMHILNNMFMLWMFGSVIERYWGPKRFLINYIITGITAALTQQIVWAIDLSSVTSGVYQFVNLGDNGIIPVAEFLNMPTTVGASGAVFGLLLAYGMLFPNTEMYYLFLPIPIKAKYIVLLFGAYELFSGVHATGSNVAHFAHLGGMIGGIILILLWRRKKIISGPYN